MRNIIYCGIGAGVGSAVYQITAHGLSETDWYRPIFVGLFAMLFFGFLQRVSVASPKTKMREHGFLKVSLVLFSHHAYNNRHQKRALWALDSQHVARVCGGRYEVKTIA